MTRVSLDTVPLNGLHLSRPRQNLLRHLLTNNVIRTVWVLRIRGFEP